MRSRPALPLILLLGLIAGGASTQTGSAVEFCLDGEFDLGARYQGMRPEPGESYPARFCYITDDNSGRVLFHSRGQSNPDMQDEWSVAFLPPDKVRIVNRESPPDVEFTGKPVIEESLRYRRTDPRQLLAEVEAHPDWVLSRSDDSRITMQYPGSPFATRLFVAGGRLSEVHTLADIPLRGRVSVIWRWNWANRERPRLTIMVEDDVVFSAQATWRTLNVPEASELWTRSGDQEPVAVSGDRWPARIDMQLQSLADGVHIVTGVRTGFAHMVVETSQGLVIGDAPAGWIELQQLPPADLVPGYGISGLSENFIDFLKEQFPDTPIQAIAITHVHDDHAGGARAFAAAGARIYAPQRVASFLEQAMNHASMPKDRLSVSGGEVSVTPVADRLTLIDDANEVELMVLPRGPHVDTALGIWAKDGGVFFQSDLHVPRSDADAPREGRAATECWFAEWAVAHLPPDTVVVNSHSPVQTPVSRLARYLESGVCRDL